MIRSSQIPEHCEKCGFELNGEAAHIEEMDEIWCHSCADNRAEAAWERHCNDYEGPLPLIEQQRQAWRLK
jgi:hypothetical protein